MIEIVDKDIAKQALTPLIRVNNIKKHFPIKKGILKKTVGYVKAVDGISFDIYKGETLGIVGESGSGKSTLGRVMLKLMSSTDGEIYYKSTDLTYFGESEMRAYRQDLQMIFQDPYSSLNPKMNVHELLEEPLLIQTSLSKEERREKVRAMIEKVGLRQSDLQKYPHEFSGGQRQRISIARALILEPKFVVCDESVSALDVSIQGQILNLMKDLQDELQLTYMFISHDLSVVHHMSDRVAVMYLGQIMEIAKNEDIYNNPLHPYTKALLASIPTGDEEEAHEEVRLKGDIPSPANPPQGCPLSTRCPFAFDRCHKEAPKLLKQKDDQQVACHLYDKQ